MNLSTGKTVCVVNFVNVNVSDTQVVGETTSTLFSVLNQGPVDMMIIMKNSGVNVISYDFQQWTGSAWTDLGPIGSDFQNTLSQNEVKSLRVTSAFPQVRLVGNASGGASLDFDILRYVERSSGGAVPILNL